MISKATLADTSAINQLVNSAYRGESSKQGWTTEAHLLGGIRIDEDGVRKLIEGQASFLLKYTENEQILASVLLEQQDDKLYLGMLTVSPVLQNKGIGKKLLQAAELQAKAMNLAKISMTVISARTELIAWYARHGYVATGQTKPFPMDDPTFGLPKQFLEFIVMEKPMV
jgi:ribosomal protein S18 acetylase RimI-like enzyme